MDAFHDAYAKVHCTGTDDSCVDEFKASGTSCGDSGTQCRIQDTRDGLGGDCIDNGFKAETTACGDQTDHQCNNPDHCSGTDNSCVPDYERPGRPVEMLRAPASTPMRVTTLEANAALRCIVRLDTSEGYQEFLTLSDC